MFIILVRCHRGLEWWPRWHLVTAWHVHRWRNSSINIFFVVGCMILLFNFWKIKPRWIYGLKRILETQTYVRYFPYSIQFLQNIYIHVVVQSPWFIERVQNINWEIPIFDLVKTFFYLLITYLCISHRKLDCNKKKNYKKNSYKRN